MKRLSLITLIFMLVITGCSTGTVTSEKGLFLPENTPVILVFIDKTTYSHVHNELSEYTEALRHDGLIPKVFVDDWESPEDIRNLIRATIKEDPGTEGAVLIGDIPIPMIRDGQHLTSAFKMDPVRFKDLQRSSIASDRFYDDLDLAFDFILQDTLDPRLFYYSLRADSPQRIQRDIYSGRIISPRYSEQKYKDIAAYLKKAAKVKYEENILDHAITFAGHGYHSESLTAWEGQLYMLREQFPGLYHPGSYLKNFYHTMGQDLKKKILYELQNPNLDMAVFHCHGGTEAQYLLGLEDPKSPTMAAEYIKRHFRSKIRTARERYGHEKGEETKAYYMDQYQVTEAWFDGLYDPESVLEDSLYYAAMDIYSSDIIETDPMARLVIFDECYNGQFFKENYISGTYIMEEGSSVTGVANTVNVKQDIWPNELFGMVYQGARIGQWHMFNTYLESHVIGDPTFHFSHESIETRWWDDLLLNAKNHPKTWEALLDSDNLTLRGLAVRKVFELEGLEGNGFLVKTFKTDPSDNVRLQALKCLAILRTPEYYDLLEDAAHDPAELIRRIAANMMGATGLDRYIPALAVAVETDVSKRVRFAAKGALEILLADEKDSCFVYVDDNKPGGQVDDINKTIRTLWMNSNRRLYDDLLTSLKDTSLTERQKNNQLRIFRNYHFPEAIPVLLEKGSSETESDYIRTVALEALGWYHLNPDVMEQSKDVLNSLIENKSISAEVKNEALKTLNRLKAGANNPITP